MIPLPFQAQNRAGSPDREGRIEPEASAIEPRGFEPIWTHRIPIAAWAYVEHESQDGVLLEFLQMRS